MAVEIPVYVNISGGIDNAVRQIPKEMPKLERAISKNVLNIPIYWSGRGFDTVRGALTSTTISGKELKQVLSDIKYQFDQASKMEAGVSRTSAKVKNLAKAYALVEQRLTGVYNKNTAAGMMVENTINKVQMKLAGLKASLSGVAVGSDQFNKINYEILVQQKRLQDLTKQLRLYKLGVDSSNSSMQKQSSLLKQLTGYFSGLYAAQTVFRFVKQIRDVTGELEYQRVALGHLLQDVDYGNELFGKIVEAAKESPFRIKDLVTYTKQLAAYRIEQEDLYDTTMRLADISAGLGVDMNRLILAYGQVRAASVLRGQELRQFTEAGIPLVDELAKKFTKLKGEMVTTADVFKLISERAVPFEYIKEIFEELTDAGGMFYKMQQEQAKTLQGRWEKLKDAYDQALMSLGENDTFQNFNDTVLNILNGLAKNLTGVVRVLNAASVGWITYKIATSNAAKATALMAKETTIATARMVKMFGVTGTLRVGIVALRQAWNRFTAALTRNWVGIALTAIATLVTYLTTFRKKVDDATHELSDMEKAIEGMKEANKTFKYGQDLISQYEELAKQTNRTGRESELMLDTINELERTFPGLTEKIDDDNMSLEERIGVMREVVNTSHEMAVQEAKNRLNTQKEIIRGLETDKKARELEKDAAQRRLEAAQAEEKAGPVISGQGYGAGTVKSAEDLANATRAAAEAAKAAQDNYDNAAIALATAKKEAEELEELVDPKKKTKDWQQWALEINELQKSMLKVGDTPLFTEADLKGFTSVYDFSQKLKKKIDDLTVSLRGMRSEYEAMAPDRKASAAGDALDKEINSTDQALQIAKAMAALLGLTFQKSSSHQTDPWITQMQDRMKFMQDFKKGYDDLRKYLGSNDALAKEAEIMKGRGLSLGLDSSQQARAASDLSKWYEDMISVVSERMRAKGARGDTVTDLLGIDTTKKSKGLQELQRLLQSLWDAKTDFDTSEKKKELENALKKLSDEIKRSETARDFYKNILDLTGDEQLAATMSLEVYGQTGDQLKEQIAKQLSDSFVIDPDLVPSDRSMDAITADISKAIASGNYGELEKFLEYVVEQNRNAASEIIQNWQKTSADRMQTWVKELQRTKEYADRRVDIERVTAERIREIQESTLPESDKASLIARYTEKQTRDIAKLQYETFKDSEMYINLFDNLDNASRRSLENMMDKLTEMRDSLKELDPTQLKDIQSRINEVDKQLARRNPFKAIADALKEYRDLREKSSRRGADEDLISASAEEAKQEERLAAAIRRAKEAQDQYNAAVKAHGADSEEANRAKNLRDMANQQLKAEKKRTKESKKSADDAQVLVHAFQKVSDQIDAAAEGLNVWQERMRLLTDGASKLMHAFASDEDADFFDEIAGNFNEILSGGIAAGQGLAKVLTGDLTGILPLAQGVVDMVAGVGNISNAARVRKANKEIERQQKIIDDLEYSYGRLSDTISETFGADYIYNFNEMISQQEAKIVALQAQLAAEQSKGRKKSKEAIEDYMRSIREAEDELADFKASASEYWAGSTLASAAQDFANAWYEAYREYGNTLDAMKERMNDMVQNLIVKSAMAGVVEAVFKPWFDKLNEATARGTLTDDVVSLVNELDTVVLDANNGLSVVANKFRSLGYELRGSATSFTGISRDIASASEESINGLAAGINTQNFYISHVPTISENVAAILALMSGGATMIPNETPENGGLSYTDQMLSYASYIPQMSTDMYAVRSLLEKVIKPFGNAYYVSVR